MRAYSLIAPAKINLYLEILGNRPDGYHELVMILQSIELADRLDIRANGTDAVRVHCNHPDVPLDTSNLAYRAAQLMVKQFPDAYENYGGVDIEIEKNIPVAAGLAGGSTNAAATLVGLNLMWQLGLTHPELEFLAQELGSDVPFCVQGGSAIATGRGEQLDPISSPHNLYLVLAKYRNLAVSTPWAYKTYRQEFGHEYLSDPAQIQTESTKMHSSPLVNAITHSSGGDIGKLLHNDLEKVVLPAYPQVAKVREAFAQTDIFGTMMSGSGPTVFALCESLEKAQQAKDQVKEAIADPELEFWVTAVSSQGIQIGLSANL